jgi:DNA-binding NtrC family response regulator
VGDAFDTCSATIGKSEEEAPLVLVLTARAEIANQCQLRLEKRPRDGYRAEVIAGGIEALNGYGRLRLVLLDLGCPPIGGFEVVKRIRRAHPGVPFVLFSTGGDFADFLKAVEGETSGRMSGSDSAAGFSQLADALLNGDQPELAGEAVHRVPLPSFTESVPQLPQNPKMRAIRSILLRVSQGDAPVLLEGESGVGKEALARELHALSPRAGMPLVKLNCAAMPSELLESELFGYERGAFTGAYKQTQGQFELAHGGTILLDEIGDMDIRLQAKLLHVLQDGEFRRVGGKETIRVDVRIMAATNCDLPKAVEQGRFRADLYHRLDVIRIDVPPLRERKDEIIPLAEHFLAKYAQPETTITAINEELKAALLEHDWPGNIRELENLIKRLIVLEDEGMVLEQLRARRRCEQVRAAAVVKEPLEPVWRCEDCRPSVFAEASRVKTDMESEAIRVALDTARWNRRKAAALLGIEYRSFLYRLKKLGIDA